MFHHTFLSTIPKGLPNVSIRTAIPYLSSSSLSYIIPSSSTRSLTSLLSSSSSSSSSSATLSSSVSTVLTSTHRSGHPSWTPSSSLITIPKRYMGIMDRLQSFASGKKQEVIDAKGVEMFQRQLDLWKNSPQYTLNEHFQMVEEMAKAAGATGWKRTLLTDEQKATLDEVLATLKLNEIFTPAEKLQPSSITNESKNNAVQKTGLTLMKINAFLQDYEQCAAVHKWLQERKAAGKALPNTMEEYTHTMISDKVRIRKLTTANNNPNPSSINNSHTKRAKAAGGQQALRRR